MTAAQLAAVADLERRVVGQDGGRLKLEWGVLRSRTAERPSDLLAWTDGSARRKLLGYAGLYQFGGGHIEVAGMVHPTVRRQGTGSSLLDAALAEVRRREADHVLLVVPGQSEGGRALAERRGGVLDHSEHALMLDGDPVDGPSDDRVTLRGATAADDPVRRRLMTDGFGWAPPPGDRDREDECTLMVERDGEVVGSLRCTVVDGRGGIYGFVIDPPWQGRGIGRDVLRRACHRLRAEGAAQVGLEVEVQNARALGLYTSLGFAPVSTEDYWRVPAPCPSDASEAADPQAGQHQP